MKAFFVGLMVLALVGVLSVVGILLLPVLLVMGLFLRFLLGIFIALFVIWLVGKVTLLAIDYSQKKDPKLIQ